MNTLLKRLVAVVTIMTFAIFSQALVAQTTVGGSLTADNSFTAFISTDDAVEGTPIGSGADFNVGHALTETALTPGTTNYLHVTGVDTGIVAMLIGEISLTGTGWEFADGSTTLQTGTAGWTSNVVGWGDASAAAPVVVPADPAWATAGGIYPSADFIWQSTDLPPVTPVYFSAAIIPVEADMAMTATDAPDPVVAGSGVGNLVHVLTLTNNGPANATGSQATIVPVLPAGVTPVSAIPDIGTFDLGTGLWTIGDHPVGVTATLEIILTVDSSTAAGVDVISATGTATANETDPDPSNNTAVDPTTVAREVDMAMTATDTPDPVVAGSGVGNLVHVLTLSNNGPSDATGSQATIVPVLPAGVTPVSAIPDIGTFDLGTGLWTIGDHPAGVTATLEIILTVDSSTAPGVDVISATGTATANETDTDPSNNTAVDPTSVVGEVDMAMTATDTPDPVIAGSGVGNLVHVLTLSNNGPSDATGSQATIVPVLPAGVTPVSAIPDIGTFDLGTGLWTIGDHPAGVTATLEIILTVDSSTAAGVDVISATGTATANETDTDPSNNSAVDPTSVIRVSDLVAESKTADPDPVAAGAQLTYTLTVVNDGPSDADNVTVTDTLPVGTTHVSNTGGCTEAGGVVTCNLGTLTAATARSFDIVVDVDVALANNTVLSNSFSVVSDSEDPDETNNALDPATETTVITEAYWEVTKYWNRGGSGSVTVTLTCDGIAPVSGIANPGTPTTLTATGWVNGATGCVVTEDVPGGTFEEYSVDCSVDDVVSNTTYICDIGNSEAFATFAVRKRFMDGNDVTPVTFHMDCNNGLPTEQQLTVVPDTGDFDRGDYEVNFVVTKFAPGQMDCTVYEEPVGGYTASYVCGSVNNPDQECTDGDRSAIDQWGTGPCFFEDVDSAGAFDSINYCTIRNYPNPGEIEITKEWVIEGAGGNALDLEARIGIVSTAEVEGSHECQGNKWCRNVKFDKGVDETKTLEVETSFEGTVVYLEEDVYDSTFVTENDCNGMLTVYPTGYEGNDGTESCTFTNTAFFEGIPTLNQWGMMIMVLLTLGIGMVGFRRFS